MAKVYEDIFNTPGSLDVWDQMMGESKVWDQMTAFVQGGSKKDLKDSVLKSMYDELSNSGATLDEIRRIFSEVDVDLTAKWQASATKRGDW